MRALLLVVLFALSFPAAAAERVGLVIGISDYRSIPPLKNTVNDATDLSETLKSIGFEVTTLINVSGAELRKALDEFAFKAEEAELALIYFAGHGVEVQGENFLIPVDADVKSNKDIQQQSVSLKGLLQSVDRARKMRIVILDSCRDNPFGDTIDLTQPVEAGDSSFATRGARGLAPPSPERGTMVAFAARDGNVALDGVGDNSPFALALMDKLARPELEISLMFRAVRDDVLQRTGNRQEPHTYGSLTGLPVFVAAPGLRDQTLALGMRGRIEAWSKVNPNLEKQYEILAEDQNDVRAMIILGMMRLHPESPRYDPAAARGYLERAAKLGDPEAMYELGRLYETGIGTAPDPAKALSYYQAAARQDYGPALSDMGFFQIEGMLGLLPDTEKGIDFFRRGAERNNAPAMFNYASMIDDGFVEGKTAEDAAAYFYQALRAGNPEVLSALTLHHDTLLPATRRALQKKLAENEFYKGSIDGDFGPGTQRSLRAAYGQSEG